MKRSQDRNANSPYVARVVSATQKLMDANATGNRHKIAAATRKFNKTARNADVGIAIETILKTRG